MFRQVDARAPSAAALAPAISAARTRSFDYVAWVREFTERYRRLPFTNVDGTDEQVFVDEESSNQRADEDDDDETEEDPLRL